jgi:hypothetical protein
LYKDHRKSSWKAFLKQSQQQIVVQTPRATSCSVSTISAGAISNSSAATPAIFTALGDTPLP